MTTGKYLLRVEAINIDNVIADTNQLSVMRGGGLLLRDAIEELWAWLETLDGDVKKISIGGSIGLFLLSSTIPKAELVASVEAILTGESSSSSQESTLFKHYTNWKTDTEQSLVLGDLSQHATFAVAATDVDDPDIQQRNEPSSIFVANEKALASIRLKQLRQPQVSVCETNSESNTEIVCEWDGLRPAWERDGSTINLSRSVGARFEYGRHIKKNSAPYRFFNREVHKAALNTDLPPDDRILALLERFDQEILSSKSANTSIFPNDFSEIVAGWGPERLQSKLAVIYADGNKFSSYSRTHCKTMEDLQKWDDFIQRERGRSLLELICWLDDKRKQNTRTSKLPLEILLWGGDEVMIVLPAALALEGLHRFFEFNSGLNPGLDCGSIKLTHSTGLVICNYKTPIDKVKQLAVNLADRVKDDLGPELSRQKNAWMYAVLESVDTPGSLDAFLKARYAQLAGTAQPLGVARIQWTEKLKVHRDLVAAIPRSQLYQVCRSVSDVPDDQEALHRLGQVTGYSPSELAENIQKVFAPVNLAEEGANPDPWAFIHWAELLDYWPEETDSQRSPRSAHKVAAEAG